VASIILVAVVISYQIYGINCVLM